MHKWGSNYGSELIWGQNKETRRLNRDGELWLKKMLEKQPLCKCRVRVVLVLQLWRFPSFSFLSGINFLERKFRKKGNSGNPEFKEKMWPEELLIRAFSSWFYQVFFVSPWLNQLRWDWSHLILALIQFLCFSIVSNAVKGWLILPGNTWETCHMEVLTC